MNFHNKEIVDVFSWTNTKFVEGQEEEVIINGRKWVKVGKKQNVTFVCVKYQSIEPSNKPNNKYFISIGVAVQHPNDYHAKLSEGEEVAHTNALVNPCITMDVDEYFDNIDFYRFIKSYYFSFFDYKLKLVKTKEEIDFGMDTAEAINHIKREVGNVNMI